MELIFSYEQFKITLLFCLKHSAFHTQILLTVNDRNLDVHILFSLSLSGCFQRKFNITILIHILSMLNVCVRVFNLWITNMKDMEWHVNCHLSRTYNEEENQFILHIFWKGWMEFKRHFYYYALSQHTHTNIRFEQEITCPYLIHIQQICAYIVINPQYSKLKGWRSYIFLVMHKFTRSSSLLSTCICWVWCCVVYY